MPPPPSTPGPAVGDNSAAVAREDAGYHHDLNNRQMQMIAIGGAIGTGLFMGAGARLASAGPGLFLIYGICGAFVFLILRALGDAGLTPTQVAKIVRIAPATASRHLALLVRDAGLPAPRLLRGRAALHQE